ncbi:dihydropteroate synthase [Paracoccus aminophilus]|uniref:Dihydropteroate synthase n=1 Tax=Paracoccus aminophilus JCM 7686 TaxID=1367847 RepID=S5XWK4_PARAH|nr:dihydropteroate synthase [Paracoccus aminophilus]AGT09667.1 dihydropteroate synthase [Paracoccus aminophilus JCM 7686]
MTQKDYYRPIPSETGRWRLAGGWVRFSQCELLRRGAAPEIVDEIPPDWLARLTAPRPSVLGLSLEVPRLMAILNATPDSFSDGGLLGEGAQAVARGEALIAAGADLLDIGGESTRPGAAEVAVSDEIARVVPVIAGLAGAAPISVDTRKAKVAASALKAGAGMVNDVSGFDFDPCMAKVVSHSGAALCLMHAQGLPETMQDDPRYGDVLLDVYDALAERVARALTAGVSAAKIVIDPGIGFGKTEAHNLAILRRISLYHGLGLPVLLGISRKRFIGQIGQAEAAAARMPGTLALTLAAIGQGVQIHRVHDVAEIKQGLRLWSALDLGMSG